MTDSMIHKLIMVTTLQILFRLSVRQIPGTGLCRIGKFDYVEAVSVKNRKQLPGDLP